MSKKKKYILEWDDTTGAYYILGIVSSSSHLTLVHNLNKTEYFNFERQNELELLTGSEAIYFISFTNNDTENNNEFRLIKNKGTKGILGKEFKGLDYILIPNPENTDMISTIKEILLEQKLVQAIIEIEIQKLSSNTKKILGI